MTYTILETLFYLFGGWHTINPREIRERNQLSDSDLSGTGGVLRGVDGRWLESGQQKMAGIMAQSGQG